MQRRREGTSSVAFEVLRINCKKGFINLFIFNYLASNINLLIFNCLTWDINLFIFNFLRQIFVFEKVYISQAEENGCLWMRVFILGKTHSRKWHRILCTSILQCRFSRKGIKLIRFILFEVLGVPEPWDTSV